MAPSADSPRSQLRFLTCGSVDDGKSTLIGRLLHDAGAMTDDQLASLVEDSRIGGTRGEAIDFAMTVDGLTAEREQGITIDVAYRYFATARRSFVVADTPGHEQYTRNMVTGASHCDLAVILVDATRGILTQTRRHAYLVGLLGIQDAVLAVNKMDRVGYDRAVFEAITAEFDAFAAQVGLSRVVSVPIVAVDGDNVVGRSGRMPWYAGPPLLEWLETVDVPSRDQRVERPLRFPVQWVNRRSADFRGLAGTIVEGGVRVGDRVRVLPGGRTTRIDRIVAMDGDRATASAGDAPVLTLADPLDCARGDVIVTADDVPEVADQFSADIIWFDEAPLLPGRGYWLKLATQTVTAQLQPPKHVKNVDTLDNLAARTLDQNAIGVVELATDRPIVFEPYAQSRGLGGFILIDKTSKATVGAGLIRFALRRAGNLAWQAIDITRRQHAEQKNQRPAVLWFTGLSGSGKSTIANLVEKQLFAAGRHTCLLDGDNVRHGLCRDLGFTDADRVENIRRVGEVARLMSDAGLIVLTAFISPFRAERDMVRAMMADGEFIEIFIDTPLAEAERRDPKGLYAKARAGKIANFTGISSPYEPPSAPDIRIDTTTESAEDAATRIVAHLTGVER